MRRNARTLCVAAMSVVAGLQTSGVSGFSASTSLSSTGTQFIAGQAEFLLKGFGITGGCLESMIRLPGPMTLQSQDMLLECSLQSYGENETLVFRAADKSCRTLDARKAGPVSYEFPIHAPRTPYSGSLEEVSDAIFLDDDAAVLALNLRTSELARVGTVTCATVPGEAEIIIEDGFE